jgi:hypothetical protein
MDIAAAFYNYPSGTNPSNLAPYKVSDTAWGFREMKYAWHHAVLNFRKTLDSSRQVREIRTSTFIGHDRI